MVDQDLLGREPPRSIIVKDYEEQNGIIWYKVFLLCASDGSGMEKFGFGRVWVYPNFHMLGSGMSGIGKVGFGRVLKFRVSGIFG